MWLVFDRGAANAMGDPQAGSGVYLCESHGQVPLSAYGLPAAVGFYTAWISPQYPDGAVGSVGCYGSLVVVPGCVSPLSFGIYRD